MTPEAQSVLVVDDEPGMRAALTANLQRDGWRVESACGAAEAMDKFYRCDFPLVVTDMRMPDGDGIQVARSVRAKSPSTAVIVLTAFGSVPEAVLAMRGGASDYLLKPFAFDQLRQVIQRVMSNQPKCQTSGTPNNTPLLGESPALLRALERASAASRTDADVLIEAESGTGKELLARYIHEHSLRHNRRFVAVNCAAVPETLLESELFGHARGAFTGAIATKQGKFELANGGTLLLDEVGEMPLSLQPKLLRVLQEREFERIGETRVQSWHARVIATTNLPLLSLVESGRFRADLYYRLNVIPLTLPPLRERREDVPVLVQHFAQRIANENGKPAPHISAGFLDRLQEHRWPGNVRELLNLMRRVIALSAANHLDESCLQDDLPFTSRPLLLDCANVTRTAPLLVPGTRIRTLERQLLEKTLLQTSGNRTRAAELLGISVRTMRNKIREYGLPPRRYD